MNKQNYIIITILLVLTFSLAACGGSSGTEREQPAAPAEQEEPTAIPAPVGDAAKGKEEFEKTCSACHGPEGKGIEGLGKDMTSSEFIAGLSDEELVAFIKIGRTTSDPLNTTGVDMPPKGGNPALNEDDLYDIVAFMRTIHQE